MSLHSNGSVRNIKFAVVGTGWRAEFFTRLASAIPGVELKFKSHQLMITMQYL